MLPMLTGVGGTNPTVGADRTIDAPLRLLIIDYCAERHRGSTRGLRRPHQRSRRFAVRIFLNLLKPSWFSRWYDAAGTQITEDSRRERLLSDSETWIVPAIALRQASIDTSPLQSASTSPTRQLLRCQSCGEQTPHRFDSREGSPPAVWAGESVWQCSVCRTPQYGPDPDI